MKSFARIPLYCLPLVVLAGCNNMAKSLENEVVSSMQYDRLSCQELVARRDGLAAVHGEPATLADNQKAGARPAYLPAGFGTAVPDARPVDVREKRRALGEIEAMDHSIERRDCRGDGRGKRRRPA
jgi:hypothetical protein